MTEKKKSEYDYVDYFKIDPEPLSIFADMDIMYGAGIKEITIVCNGNTYVLSKNIIESFLKTLLKIEGIK